MRSSAGSSLNEKGFTLLEFVLSMGILVFVMSGTTSIYVNLLNGTGLGRNRGEAAFLAQSYLEKLQVQVRQGDTASCSENSKYPKNSLNCPSIKEGDEDECNFIRTTGQKIYHVFLTHRQAGFGDELREVRVFVCQENSVLLGHSEVRGLASSVY